jgi:LacI family transcriptional regulator
MPRTLRPVTTHDVAARAGVSQATASLVLSGNTRARVADATRARVRQAAEDLGYRPNLIARGLVRRRSYAVGVVVPDLSNPFFADLIRGVERVAAEEGYAVLLCDARERSVAAHVETLRERLVDGVIIDSIGSSELSEDELAGLNVVLLDQPSERWAAVTSDAAEAGRLAARHLIGLGHSRIGFIGPAADVHAFRMRERGFVQELRAAGLRPRSEWFQRAPASVEGGLTGMRAIRDQAERPSAVFCVNDLLALGALKSCLSAGIEVPGEMSIVGCDDIEMARVVTPELTTVTIPAAEMGARAARLLLRGGRSRKPLAVRLRVRGTTSPPRSIPHSSGAA